MTNQLLHAVRRYAEANANQSGIAQTPIEGLMIIRMDKPSGLIHAISKPLVCLVLQGHKQVTVGTNTFNFGAGDSLLITADVPMVSQVIEASPSAPYFSMVIDLDLPLIAELTVQIGESSTRLRQTAKIEPTDSQVAEAALRLMQLLEHPAAVPVLRAQLVRELHYWLLAGQHGSAIRQLGWPNGDAQRIARAVAIIRSDFAQPLLVDDLATVSGMSPSSFYQHFRAVTSLSPLQFQKQLRLIEARRLMFSEGMNAGTAAFEVGYESVPQFTREYHRLFGLPPAKDKEAVRIRASIVSEGPA